LDLKLTAVTMDLRPLRRLFLGRGRLPEPLRAQILADDVLLLEEGLFGSVTYRHYRAPGKRMSFAKHATSAAIAITSTRLVVWAGGMKQIDVPDAHPLRTTINVRLETPGRVRFTYDAGATNTALSGQVDVRLHTGRAARIAELCPLARQ
jgi:hypothetical protein